MTFSIHRNRAALERGPYPFEHLLSVIRAKEIKGLIEACPLYSETPLLHLSDYARRASVGDIIYKDESDRLGLASFKSLGGAYAVLRILHARIELLLGRKIPIQEVACGKHRDLIADFTVTCATDGNHGRSVAAGAAAFGCRCVIYLHEKVSQGREDAITALGARVCRVRGNYDDSVHAVKTDAKLNEWTIVADTSWEGYEEIPLMVMQGYTVLVVELLDQLRRANIGPPTHVFLQGGVGGLAAAVVAHLWEGLGTQAPKFIIVEPQRADCLIQSAIAGRPAPATGNLDTVMAGLSCGEVSGVAWRILQPSVEYYMTIADEPAVRLMRELACRTPPIIAGESATAGLAGLLEVCTDPALKREMRLDGQSRVLVIGTEGATDPDLYASIVGQSPKWTGP